MKFLELQQDWPASWKASYPYDLQEVYGRPAYWGYTYAYQNRRKRTLDLLTEVVPPGARVLDIAAAQGNFSLSLAEAGYVVTWNDLRADLEGYVRAKWERGQIEYAPGNAFELHFEAPFDAVLITEVIEHVAHPDQFLASVARLVKPGGYIVMTTPNGGYCRNTLPKFSDCEDPSLYESVQFGPNSDAHIFLLHGDEVLGFAKQVGLQTERLDFFTSPLTNGYLKTESLLRHLPESLVWRAERWAQALPEGARRKLLVHIAARFRVPPAGTGH